MIPHYEATRDNLHFSQVIVVRHDHFCSSCVMPTLLFIQEEISHRDSPEAPENGWHEKEFLFSEFSGMRKAREKHLHYYKLHTYECMRILCYTTSFHHVPVNFSVQKSALLSVHKDTHEKVQNKNKFAVYAVYAVYFFHTKVTAILTCLPNVTNVHDSTCIY